MKLASALCWAAKKQEAKDPHLCKLLWEAYFHLEAEQYPLRSPNDLFTLYPEAAA